MSGQACQVVRLGGSLLDLDQLVERWWQWLRSSGARQTVVLVGGGEAVDTLRQQQQTQGLTDEQAHWAAIAAMGANARRFAERIFGQAAEQLIADRLAGLSQLSGTLPLVFVDPLPLLREDEPQAEGARLPISWDVTSDSIAARVAGLIYFRRLVLLKSSLPDNSWNCAQAAAAGYVDRYFPTAAQGLDEIVCVNLRAAEMPSTRLVR